jgi:type VI secretion system protein ImpH
VPASHRQAEPDLKARIVDEGYLFDFFQLIYLLERWLDRPAPIGRLGPYRDEGVRLRPDTSLAFPPSDVWRVEVPDEDDKRHEATWAYRVVVSFLGLYGSSSPTPTYLSELLGFTDVDADPLVDFLDLFNHRLISLYYRAWVRYRYPYRYERGGKDELSGYLLSFIGLGDPDTRRQTALPSQRLLSFIGLLSLRTHPPVALKLLVENYFGDVTANVDELMFRWVPIPRERQNRLGRANVSLGVDCTLGARIPDRSGKIRVRLGPLGFDRFLEFLPDRPNFADLCSLVNVWVFERFDYDSELIVKKDEIPPLRLAATAPPRLGWTSWLTATGGCNTDQLVVLAKKPRHTVKTQQEPTP